MGSARAPAARYDPHAGAAPRRLIARVAEALFARTTLTAEELDKLVDRSVDDVKPNHAGRYLSAMAARARSPVDIEPLGSTGLRALLTPKIGHFLHVEFELWAAVA